MPLYLETPSKQTGFPLSKNVSKKSILHFKSSSLKLALLRDGRLDRRGSDQGSDDRVLQVRHRQRRSDRCSPTSPSSLYAWTKPHRCGTAGNQQKQVQMSDR